MSIALHPSTIVLDASAQDLLFREAHTAYEFTDEPVSDEQVHDLYDLVKWAPTLMNTNPLRIVLARSDAARQRLIGHIAEGNRAKSESAPLVAVLAADVDFHETLDHLVPHVPGARELFSDDTRRETVARHQAWMQAGYFILGVRAMGLSAGPMAGFDAGAVDADLLAGTSLRSFLVVNIGHPSTDGLRPRSPRLDANTAVVTL
ncbi:MAG: malonic semialdehyde reductase [Actinomycetota bacterium]